MLSTHSQVPKEVSSWLERWISMQPFSSSTCVACVPLAGDGSTRTFFRVTWEKQSRVLLCDPDWISSKDYPAHQLFLARRTIPVPKFFDIDPDSGFLVMEDVGDELLQRRLGKLPKDKMSWLQRAATLLGQLHGTTYPVPTDLPAATRRFDAQKYFDELCFTEEHLSQNFLGLPQVNEAQRSQIRDFAGSIGQLGPDTFQHRDYHCRNLLVHEEKLVMIDFQDARLGPPHYDLASLLYDAYVPLDAGERALLLSTYVEELKKYPNLYEKIIWDSFEEDLRRIAFQRVVKAAGSFASFFTRHGKRTHLPYLVPALRSARELVRLTPTLEKSPGDAIRLDAWISLAEKKT